jgi:predicted glutamine amidotransferase
MCQLLGMNCNTPTDIVFSFSGFATRAVEHADGFGIAFFEGQGVRLFVDHQAASTSPVADLIKRSRFKAGM